MNYLKPFVTINYWFSLYPEPFVKWAFVGLGILLALIFAEGVAVKVWGYRARKNPPLHRILSRWGRAAITVSLIGAFFYFADYEQLPFVSARFWWLLLLVGAVVWKAFIVIDFRKRYPQEKAALAARLAKEKYLPK